MAEIDKNAKVNTENRSRYLARMKERLSEEMDLESDPEVRYGAFLKYDDEQQEELGKYRDGNKKLADMFGKNPKFAAMMADVCKGDDPSVAFIRFFGRDALDANGDEEKLKLITEANQEYLNRVSESNRLREQQEKNLQKSEADMEEFQKEKNLNDEDYAKFIDAVYNTVEKGLEGIIDKDFLEIFWLGLNYEKDLQEAAITGKIEGRNEKIELQNRTNKGDRVPNLSGSNLSKGGSQKLPPVVSRKDFFEGFPNE